MIDYSKISRERGIRTLKKSEGSFIDDFAFLAGHKMDLSSDNVSAHNDMMFEANLNTAHAEALAENYQYDFSNCQGLSCEKPRVIIHKYFYHRLLQYKVVRLNGREIDFTPSDIKDKTCEDIHKFFSPNRIGVSPTSVDDYMVVDRKGHRTFPIYMVVNCGHCELCLNAKRIEWSARCQLETYASGIRPLFVTLTYAHAPKNGVSKKDCQEFIDRLRKRVNYYQLTHGKDKVNLRYVLVAEYGQDDRYTHRPHYHMLLWNMPYFADQSKFCHTYGVPCPGLGVYKGFKVMSDLIHSAWNHGLVDVQVCRDVTGGYVMKYIGKGGKVPTGMNDTFMLTSRRRGIGYGSFEKYKQFLLDHPEVTSIKIPNVVNPNKPTKVGIPKYYRELLYKSPSRLLTKKQYDLVKDFYFNVNLLQKFIFPVNTLYEDLRVMKSAFEIHFDVFADTLNFGCDVVPSFYRGSVTNWLFNAPSSYLNWYVDELYLFVCWQYECVMNIPFDRDYYLATKNWHDINVLTRLKFARDDERTVEDKISAVKDKMNRVKQHILNPC